MSKNPELEALENIVREVLINFQNSSGDVLILNNFALTAGQWDPQAPDGIPLPAADRRAARPQAGAA